MSGIKEIIDQLIDSSNVLIDIPLNTGQNKRLASIYKKTDAPHLKLVFPPKSLPSSTEIDQRATCKLSIDNTDTTVTLAANIDRLESDRILILTAREPIKPELLREYFRVTIRSPITARTPVTQKTPSGPTELNGETIDISGGGLLALLPKIPLIKKNITLELHLPDNSEAIEIVSHIVRARRLKKAKFQIAFQFDEIDPKLQDRIMRCCMEQQRKQLRDNIRID